MSELYYTVKLSTPGTHNVTIPAGFSSVEIYAWGAGGANGADGPSTQVPSGTYQVQTGTKRVSQLVGQNTTQVLVAEATPSVVIPGQTIRVTNPGTQSVAIPAGVTQVAITAAGGGGSGGDGSSVSGSAGGGGAGQVVTRNVSLAGSGGSVSVTVGAGGTPVSYGSGRTGVAGGTTSVSIAAPGASTTSITAAGGAGGTRTGSNNGQSSTLGQGGTSAWGSSGQAGGLAAGGGGVDGHAGRSTSGAGGSGAVIISYDSVVIPGTAALYEKVTTPVYEDVTVPVYETFTNFSTVAGGRGGKGSGGAYAEGSTALTLSDTLSITVGSAGQASIISKNGSPIVTAASGTAGSAGSALGVDGVDAPGGVFSQGKAKKGPFDVPPSAGNGGYPGYVVLKFKRSGSIKVKNGGVWKDVTNVYYKTDRPSTYTVGSQTFSTVAQTQVYSTVSQGNPYPTETFTSPGTNTYVVPLNVLSLDFTVVGARGGNSASGDQGRQGRKIQGTINVVPGDIITVDVGGAGGNGSPNVFIPGTPGTVAVPGVPAQTFSNTYNSDNELIIPDHVTSINVDLKGGGGGGGGAHGPGCGNTGNHFGGTGGGGYTTQTSILVNKDDKVTIRIGSGGAGGANNSDGSTGGATQILVNGIVRAEALGGAGGGHGSSGGRGANGAGGSGANGGAGGVGQAAYGSAGGKGSATVSYTTQEIPAIPATPGTPNQNIAGAGGVAGTSNAEYPGTVGLSTGGGAGAGTVIKRNGIVVAVAGGGDGGGAGGTYAYSDILPSGWVQSGLGSQASVTIVPARPTITQTTTVTTPVANKFVVPVGVTKINLKYATPQGLSTREFVTTPGETITINLGDFGQETVVSGSSGTISLPAYEQPVFTFQGRLGSILTQSVQVVKSSAGSYSGSGSNNTLQSGASAAGISYSVGQDDRQSPNSTISITPVLNSTVYQPLRVVLRNTVGSTTSEFRAQPDASNNYIFTLAQRPNVNSGDFSWTAALQQQAYVEISYDKTYEAGTWVPVEQLYYKDGSWKPMVSNTPLTFT